MYTLSFPREGDDDDDDDDDRTMLKHTSIGTSRMTSHSISPKFSLNSIR